jgi:divalent metal cation (Fe/Co/Zn/Cd) transporter
MPAITTTEKQLRHAIGTISGVNSVHSLRTRKIGSAISADVHVQVDPFLSVSDKILLPLLSVSKQLRGR